MADAVLIETPKLILRTVTVEDIKDVVRSWKLDDGVISPKEADEKIKWMIGNHNQNTPQKIVHLCLAIIDRESLEFIGWCGLDHRNQTKEHPVLFYLLQENYWGYGLGTEAASAVIDYAFCELAIARIDSSTAIDNIASKRVMEKIGMRFLSTDEDDGHFFTLTKEEYIQTSVAS